MTLCVFVTDLKDHWEVPEGYGTFTLEATAYALLALLKADHLQEAGPIVKWLRRQRRFGGGYGSTQVCTHTHTALGCIWRYTDTY